MHQAACLALGAGTSMPERSGAGRRRL